MATNDSPLLTVREVRDLKDKTIMRRVQAGDAAALGILFERYSRLVLNGAMRILRDRAEAQDLLQNVFLYILRRGCMFDPARGTVASWVLQLTYSRSLNRRNGYLTRLSLRAVPVHVATDLADPETGADGDQPEFLYQHE
jgi:RNA polymerase sigma-70 factor (ECF subfamily)